MSKLQQIINEIRAESLPFTPRRPAPRLPQPPATPPLAPSPPVASASSESSVDNPSPPPAIQIPPLISNPPSPRVLLAHLSKSRSRPAALAAALNIPLPNDPRTLQNFDRSLDLYASQAAGAAIHHLSHIMKTSKSPETSRRTAMALLNLSKSIQTHTPHSPPPLNTIRRRPTPPPRQPKSARALSLAILWLYEALTPAPLPAETLIAAALSLGISLKTLKRAKSLLKVSSSRTHTRWLWSLPQPVPRPQSPWIPIPGTPSPSPAQSGPLAPISREIRKI